MKIALLALAGTAVALSAVPVEARHHGNACSNWRHGRCVAMLRTGAGYRVGYNFGPSYAYSDLSALPQPLVTRYHLGSNYRYVNQNGSVYVVNPSTYRVVRVIRAPM